MKQTRTSVTVACAQATTILKQTGKTVFNDRDIRVALLKAGRGSTTSLIHYMGPDGHLRVRGFLVPTMGGYELSGPSMGTDKITIELSIENEFLIGEVSAVIGRALEPFKGVVTDTMEV